MMNLRQRSLKVLPSKRAAQSNTTQQNTTIRETRVRNRASAKTKVIPETDNNTPMESWPVAPDIIPSAVHIAKPINDRTE